MMRRKRTLAVVLLWICVPGCRLTSAIAHNACFETALFSDEVCSQCHYWWLAQSLWKQYETAHPNLPNASDFGKGFRAGFVDYLTAGGNGCAPPIPPAKYWVTGSPPEQRQAANAWTQGFREGVAAAKATGYREQIVLSLTKCESPPPLPPSPPAPHPTGPAPVPPPSPGPVPQPLPPPRPVQPEDLPPPRQVPQAGRLPTKPPSPGASAPVAPDVEVETEEAQLLPPMPCTGPIVAPGRQVPRRASSSRGGPGQPTKAKPEACPVRLSRDDPGTLFGGSTGNTPSEEPMTWGIERCPQAGRRSTGPPLPCAPATVAPGRQVPTKANGSRGGPGQPNTAKPEACPVRLSRDDPGTLFGSSTGNMPKEEPTTWGIER